MNYSEDRVSILGCGWFGLPLAEKLIATGYKVSGSTTSPEKLDLLRQKSIQPYLLNLSEQTNKTELTEFLKTDHLVISFPPRLRAGLGQNYLPQIHYLNTVLKNSAVKTVVFISSTSVYHDVNGIISEDDVNALDTESPLYQAEELIKESNSKTTTILRFGGLVGGNRHPGRFLAGKTGVPNPDAPVNLIHLDDCIAIVSKIIFKEVQNETFNAVANQHPSRQDFYTAAAHSLQLEPPQFAPSTKEEFKIIINEKLKAKLPYEFIHPDPMFFF